MSLYRNAGVEPEDTEHLFTDLLDYQEQLESGVSFGDDIDDTRRNLARGIAQYDANMQGVSLDQMLSNIAVRRGLGPAARGEALYQQYGMEMYDARFVDKYMDKLVATLDGMTVDDRMADANEDYRKDMMNMYGDSDTMYHAVIDKYNMDPSMSFDELPAYVSDELESMGYLDLLEAESLKNEPLHDTITTKEYGTVERIYGEPEEHRHGFPIDENGDMYDDGYSFDE